MLKSKVGKWANTSMPASITLCSLVKDSNNWVVRLVHPLWDCVASWGLSDQKEASNFALRSASQFCTNTFPATSLPTLCVQEEGNPGRDSGFTVMGSWVLLSFSGNGEKIFKIKGSARCFLLEFNPRSRALLVSSSRGMLSGASPRPELRLGQCQGFAKTWCCYKQDCKAKCRFRTLYLVKVIIILFIGRGKKMTEDVTIQKSSKLLIYGLTVCWNRKADPWGLNCADSGKMASCR